MAISKPARSGPRDCTLAVLLGWHRGFGAKAVPAPHLGNMVFGGRTPLQGREALAGFGYATVICANAALQAATRGMLAILQHLKKHETLAGAEALMVSFAERQSLVDMDFFEELGRRYRREGN